MCYRTMQRVASCKVLPVIIALADVVVPPFLLLLLLLDILMHCCGHRCGCVKVLSFLNVCVSGCFWSDLFGLSNI